MNVSKYANTEQLALPLTSSVQNKTSTGGVFGLHSFPGIGCSRKVGAGGTAVRGLAEFEFMLTLLVVVYGVEDDALVVVVMAADKREDSVVYRSAVARIVEKVSTLADAIKQKLPG